MTAAGRSTPVRRPARAPRRITGLTLLEMLVVLVLLSLVATLAIQGLGYVLNQQRRFADFAEAARADTLRYAWYRDVIGGLYPARSGEPGRFQGRPDRVQGVTLNPLTRPGGVPGGFRLSLVTAGGETILRYAEPGGHSWVLARLADGARPGFEFLDASGQWHPRWPPEEAQRPEQLPHAVALRLDTAADAAAPWIVAVQSRRTARRSIRDHLQ